MIEFQKFIFQFKLHRSFTLPFFIISHFLFGHLPFALYYLLHFINDIIYFVLLLLSFMFTSCFPPKNQSYAFFLLFNNFISILCKSYLLFSLKKFSFFHECFFFCNFNCLKLSAFKVYIAEFFIAMKMRKKRREKKSLLYPSLTTCGALFS